jgi:uncharacterized protein (TIGR02996 family)
MAWLGGSPYSMGTHGQRLQVMLGENQFFLFDARTASLEPVPSFGGQDEEESSRPFELTCFGSKRRLVWPHGACGFPERVRVVFHAQRYAFVFDRDLVTLVDARSPRMVRLSLAGIPLLPLSAIHAGHGFLAFQFDRGYALLAADELAAVEPGEASFEIERVYPLGRPAGLYELPVRLLAQAAAARPSDPAARRKDTEPPREVLGALFEEILASPGDDRPRQVYADALQERRDEYGEFISLHLHGGAPAQERLGSLKRRHQKRWLGPLGHFLEAVEYERGMPVSARLRQSAPEDAGLTQEAAEDPRLGTFECLRCGKGPARVHRALIASPRALALRRVDAPRAEDLEALVKARKDALTCLLGLCTYEPDIRRLLAGPTFERVVGLEFAVHRESVARLLDAIAEDSHGFFSRRRCSVAVVERDLRRTSFVPQCLRAWPRLAGLAALSVGDVSLRREAGGTVARFAPIDLPGGPGFPSAQGADPYQAALLSEHVRDLRAVELAAATPAALEELRRRFPAVEVLAVAGPAPGSK